MGIVSVIVAAAAAYAFGAIWYMSWAKQWVAAAGLATDENGQPLNKSPVPFVVSGIAMLIVAGMMRHIFAMSATDGLVSGAIAGLGLGAFIAAPWIVTNYAYADRPFMLTITDAGYALFGCAIMGAVLGLF